MTTQSDIDALKATASAIAGASTTLTIQVNNLTLAGSGGGTTPPPVVPPPTTPTGTMIPIKGPRQISMQLSWMADFIDKSYLTPREVPWTIYADPVNKVLAWPMGGQKPARIRFWHHLGAPQGLYSHMPAFDATGLSAPYEPNAGSDIAAIANHLRKASLPVGKRGIGYASPYYSLHDHPFQRPDGTFIPRAPVFAALRHDGVLDFWMPDGSIQRAGKIPGIDYCTVFVADDNNPAIFYVCDLGIPTLSTPSTWKGSRIARVDRTPGKQTATSPEDASKYKVTTLYGMEGSLPVSVRMDEFGTIYIADNISGAIDRITLNGLVSVVAMVPGIVAMDYDAGKLICVLNTSEIKVVDIATGFVGPNINLIPGQVTLPVAYGSKFWSMSIDRNGTFGTKGTIGVTRDIGGGNLDAWFFEPDGTGGYKNATFTGGQGWERVGDYKTVQENFGHYPWVVAFHRWQGIMATGGVSGTLGLLVAYKGANEVPAEIPQSKFNFEIGNRGIKLWQKGGPKDAPFNKPSLACITTKEGWSPFRGCSFDEMAEMLFGECHRFVLNGMIGQFHRDAINDDDMYCLLYWVYRNSQRFLREGQALIDALGDYWTSLGGTVPKTIDPAGHPQTVFHAPIDDTRYIFSQAKADGSGVEMWRRDWVDASIPVPPGAVVVVDEGTPWESSVLTPGDHALTVRGAGDTRAIVVRK